MTPMGGNGPSGIKLNVVFKAAGPLNQGIIKPNMIFSEVMTAWPTTVRTRIKVNVVLKAEV